MSWLIEAGFHSLVLNFSNVEIAKKIRPQNNEKREYCDAKD